MVICFVLLVALVHDGSPKNFSRIAQGDWNPFWETFQNGKLQTTNTSLSPSKLLAMSQFWNWWGLQSKLEKTLSRGPREMGAMSILLFLNFVFYFLMFVCLFVCLFVLVFPCVFLAFLVVSFHFATFLASFQRFL